MDEQAAEDAATDKGGAGQAGKGRRRKEPRFEDDEDKPTSVTGLTWRKKEKGFVVAPKKAVKELQLFVAVRAQESIFKKVGTMKTDARNARMEEAYISEVNECLSGGSPHRPSGRTSTSP